MNRIKLGIDGNAGFALLGPNLQEGECEFVEVQQIGDERISLSQIRAAKKAYLRLVERLGKAYPFYFDVSHPYGS